MNIIFIIFIIKNNNIVHYFFFFKFIIKLIKKIQVNKLDGNTSKIKIEQYYLSLKIYDGKLLLNCNIKYFFINKKKQF